MAAEVKRRASPSWPGSTRPPTRCQGRARPGQDRVLCRHRYLDPLSTAFTCSRTRNVRRPRPGMATSVAMRSNAIALTTIIEEGKSAQRHPPARLGSGSARRCSWRGRRRATPASSHGRWAGARCAPPRSNGRRRMSCRRRRWPGFRPLQHVECHRGAAGAEASGAPGGAGRDTAPGCTGEDHSGRSRQGILAVPPPQAGGSQDWTPAASPPLSRATAQYGGSGSRTAITCKGPTAIRLVARAALRCASWSSRRDGPSPPPHRHLEFVTASAARQVGRASASGGFSRRGRRPKAARSRCFRLPRRAILHSSDISAIS